MGKTLIMSTYAVIPGTSQMEMFTRYGEHNLFRLDFSNRRVKSYVQQYNAYRIGNNNLQDHTRLDTKRI